MPAELKYLPVPQKITSAAGVHVWRADDLPVALAGVSPVEARRLNAALAAAGWPARPVEAATARLVLRLDPALALPAEARSDVAAEAYELKVEPERIEVRARAAAGLYYGLQTLAQLVRQTRRLPAQLIVDWPDLPFRGLHLTLGSGHMPRPEKLRELIVCLGQYKLNYLVLEYDDRFPFDRHPALRHPSALPDKDCLRGLIDAATDNFIEVVPLLDSLGHAEQYLVHPEYRQLAELPGQIAEMCPSNPATLQFMKELWEEVLEVHAGCRYAHITGDEVFRLGSFCPECDKHARAGTLSDLFVAYYRRLSEWIMARGRRPIIWSDMLIHHPEKTGELSKEIIINDWDYNGQSKPYLDVTKLFGQGPIRPDQLDSLPADVRARFGPYLIQPHTAPNFTPFPCVQYFKDQRFEVLGASSASAESGRLAVPGWRGRISNNRAFALAVKRSAGLGLLCTFWSDFRNVLGAMQGVLAAAEYAWRAREEPEEALAARIETLFVQAAPGTITDICPALERVGAPAAGYLRGRSAPEAEKLAAAAAALRQAGEKPGVAGDFARLVAANAEQAAAIGELDTVCSQIDAGWVGTGRDRPVDLRSAANLNLDNCILGSGMNLRDMGHGSQTAWGAKFELLDPRTNAGKCVIGVYGRKVPDRPRRTAVELPEQAERLFFLHTSAYAPRGETVATYVVRYADGSAAEIPVICGQNVGDWYRGGGGGGWRLTDATIGWEGHVYGQEGPETVAYLTAWDNPRPQCPLRGLEIISAENDGFLILLALTARTGRQEAFTPEQRAQFSTRLDEIEKQAAALAKDWKRINADLMSAEDLERSLPKQYYNQMAEIAQIYRQRGGISK